MPKDLTAPSQQWNIQDQINKSKPIIQERNKTLEDYNNQTDAYRNIDSILSDYESQGIDTSTYRAKLDNKAKEMELGFGEKLGVIGRNRGVSWNKVFNAGLDLIGADVKPLELSYSQKVDEAKQKREEAINPKTTALADIALDPTNLLPLNFASKGTAGVRFAKDFGIGGAFNAGTYTINNGGDENFKPEDALIAGAFGGLVNSAIGKYASRGIKGNLVNPDVTNAYNITDRIINEGGTPYTKDVKLSEYIKSKLPAEKIVEDSSPIANETFQQNTVKSDNNTSADSIAKKLNDTYFGGKNIIPDTAPVRSDMPIVDTQEANKVNDFFNPVDNSRVQAQGNANLKTPASQEDPFVYQPKQDGIIPVTINKKEPIVNYDIPSLQEFEGLTKATGMNTADVLSLEKPTSTAGVRNSIDRYISGTATQRDHEILSAVENFMKYEGDNFRAKVNQPRYKPNMSINDAVANNMDYETANRMGAIPFSNGSQTFGGAAVGGTHAIATEQDYNNDGKTDYKDGLIGALIGAVGVKAARKIMPSAFKDKNIDGNTAGMFVGAKPNEAGSFSDVATKKVMREIDDSKTSFNLKNMENLKNSINSKIELKIENAYNRLEKGEIDLDTYTELENSLLNELKSGNIGIFKLYRIFEHDELFSKYPELRSLNIEFSDSVKKGNAQYNSGTDTITVSKWESKENLKSLVLHELQHSIQNKEGWARGGSPETFSKKLPHFEELYKQLSKERDDLTVKYLNSVDRPPEMRAEIERLTKLRDEAGKIADNPTELEKYRAYERLWGEQQARATQQRMNMTPEQRASEDWTQTLANNEGKYNDPIIKYDNGVAMSINKDTKEINFDALDKFAEPLKKSNNILTFINDFKNPIKTPIGDLKINTDYMLNKALERDSGIRINQIGYIKQTLERPAYIIEKDGKFHFIKPFIDEENNVKKFLSVVSDRSGNINMVTSHILQNKNIMKIVKDGNVIEDFVSKNDTGRFTSGGKAQQWLESNKKPDTLINKSISNNIPKSQDIKLNASPTISGGMVGGIAGANNDLNGDGKTDLKDILIGVGLGAGGTKGVLLAKNTNIATKATNIIKNLADTETADKIFGHKIYQKTDYMNLREEMISGKNKQYENFALLHEQLKLLDDTTRTKMYDYMSGNKTIQLDPNIKQLADNYTNEINKMGKDLVDLGVLEQSQFDKFKDRYLHRRYEKDFTQQFNSLFSKGKTIQGVHARGNEWNGTKTEYEQLLQDGKIGDFFDGKIEATRMNNGQYKFRQDWTEEQRTRWGEVKDIAFSLPETLMRTREMVDHANMLKKIVDNTNYVSDDAIDGYVHLAGKRYGALNGKYVPADIASDIKEFNNALFGTEGSLLSSKGMEAFKALSTFWKKSHTVYNPIAHANNLISNVTMQFGAGINPHKAVWNSLKGAFASQKVNQFRELTAKQIIGLSPEESATLRSLAQDEDLKLWNEAQQAGLFGRSNLNDILNKYVNPNTTPTSTNRFKNGLQKVDDKLSSWYQGEDNIMRFSMLKSLTEKGASLDDAIKQINNTIPDYTKPMSQWARFGRDSMLTPFISWTYYATPIILKQMKERPERIVAIYGALYGMNQIFGIDPFNEKDIPQQNFSMKRIPIYRNGDEVTTIKVDRWIPHNDVLNPLDFIKNLTSGGAWSPIKDIPRNQDSYFGGKITNKEGALKAYHLAKYGIEQITPDVLDNAYNFAESKIMSPEKRSKNPVIQPRTSTQELLKFFGINSMTYNKSNQARKAMRDKED